MSRARIDFAQHELEEICRRRAVKRLALFGSVLRDDFGTDSDIDVLIEFRDDFEGHRIYKIYDELEQLFGGRRVDLVDPKQLSPRLKRYVLENVEELYAASRGHEGEGDAAMIQIEFSRDELEAICRRRAVKRLALFGSVLRDDFGPDSDVDVIVEFRDDFEGKRIYNIYDELAALFGGRKIDLVEPEFLSPRMRRHILEHTEELYAA